LLKIHSKAKKNLGTHLNEQTCAAEIAILFVVCDWSKKAAFNFRGSNFCDVVVNPVICQRKTSIESRFIYKIFTNSC